MKNLRKLYILLLFYSSFQLIAVNRLTKETHLLQAGDKLIKQQVEFINPGPSGKNVTWDFSRLSPVKEKYKVRYLLKAKSDSTRFTVNEHETRYHYIQESETLWFLAYENRTTKMYIDHPEIVLKFPFHFDDLHDNN